MVLQCGKTIAIGKTITFTKTAVNVPRIAVFTSLYFFPAFSSYESHHAEEMVSYAYLGTAVAPGEFCDAGFILWQVYQNGQKKNFYKNSCKMCRTQDVFHPLFLPQHDQVTRDLVVKKWYILRLAQPRWTAVLICWFCSMTRQSQFAKQTPLQKPL